MSTDKKIKFVLINNSTVAENTTDNAAIGGNHMMHVRPVPLHNIDHMLKSKGYQSNIIEYFTIWDKHELKDYVLQYADDHEIVLVFSFTLYNKPQNKIAIAEFVDMVREDHTQNVYTVAGGIKEYEVGKDDSYNFLDVIYTGRTIHKFESHCESGEIFEYLEQLNKPVVFKLADSPHDPPIVHNFYEDGVWSEKDVAVFEVSMGCKFNCSFCSYDLRGIRNPTLQQIDALVNYFTTAKEHGVTHFFAGDDTINEEDSKLEILKAALEQLDYTPHIAAFVRMDMMYNKPYRVELIRDAGIKSMFFGIESMNYTANKYIRKGSSPEKIVNTLEQIRSIDPDFYLFGAFIVGLEGDSELDIRTNNNIATQYLDGLYYNPLFIQKYNPDWEWMSDIDKNPQEFGYNIVGENPNPNLIQWRNSWIDCDEAVVLAQQINDYNLKKFGMHKLMSNWFYSCAHALGTVSSPHTWGDDYRTHYGYKMDHLRMMSTPNHKAMYNYIYNKKRS